MTNETNTGLLQPRGCGRPVLMKRFVPLLAKINRLHLCAFWPTREILSLQLTGKE